MSDKTHKDTYLKSRRILEQGSVRKRRNVAADKSSEPEILYYLASDDDSNVRIDVAGNPCTPAKADRILAEDSDGDVRVELTRKIVRLMPGLGDEEAHELWQHTVEILTLLADDQLTKVRRILAEEIKNSKDVPKSIVQKLALDQEAAVAAPILEYSPLLSDLDLKEIIAAGVARGAVLSIARRRQISGDLAESIVGTLDIPAITELLANADADIRDATIDQIIDQIGEIPELHEPLAMRPNLSMRLMKRIAGFVASSLVHAMVENNDLPESAASEIISRVRKRIDNDEGDEDDDTVIAERVADFHARGMLDDEFITDGIVNHRRRLVIHALALLANAGTDSIERILESKNGRAVTALSWRAGLSMRTALAMQSKFAFIPPDRFMAAKGGIDYPLTEAELEQEMAFFLD